ncbi:MAG: hypothetical protein WCF57_09410 [Pyrinomonadaceae bacterium]
MIEAKPHTIELRTGYKDNSGIVHKSVTFGKPATGATAFAIDEDPQSSLFTQKELLTISKTITAFGSLTMPVPMSVLLDLDEIDTDDLIRGYQHFTSQITNGREPEFISESEVKLSIGFEKDGLLYPRVCFGRKVTGRDKVQADLNEYGDLKRTCFLIGRRIVSLKTEDGSSELQGAVDIDLFNTLYGGDILPLIVASERWRSTFRHPRKDIQGEGVRA